jgi:hypothetical protein
MTVRDCDRNNVAAARQGRAEYAGGLLEPGEDVSDVAAEYCYCGRAAKKQTEHHHSDSSPAADAVL